MQKAKIRATLKNQRIQKSRYLENPKQLEISPQKMLQIQKVQKAKKKQKMQKILDNLKTSKTFKI